jgi:hypothetical protein
LRDYQIVFIIRSTIRIIAMIVLLLGRISFRKHGLQNIGPHLARSLQDGGALVKAGFLAGLLFVRVARGAMGQDGERLVGRHETNPTVLATGGSVGWQEHITRLATDRQEEAFVALGGAETDVQGGFRRRTSRARVRLAGKGIDFDLQEHFILAKGREEYPNSRQQRAYERWSEETGVCAVANAGSKFFVHVNIAHDVISVPIREPRDAQQADS